MRTKRVWPGIAAGFLLLTLILPQSVLAAGPEISDVEVPDISFASATITWTTNTTSNSRVNYGTDRPKDVTWESVQDASEVTHHSMHIEGLATGEIYYFEVVSTDGSGTTTDNNGGEYYSFKTLAWYSISLNPVVGSCAGEDVTVTATVAVPGAYGISWDSLANTKTTFTASTAGVYHPKLIIPEATKGVHTVYLVDSTVAQKAEASFEIVPSVQINHDEGYVGTVVTLTGCGFEASQSIQVKFEGTSIGTAQTTTTGRWSAISYTIPDMPGGDYNFVVDVDGVVWATQPFEVIPQITAPSSGTVGHTIEVIGTGFQSNERNIKITFDGKVVQTNTPIVARDNGSWDASIVIPLVERGTHTIDASGDETSASDVPSFDIIVGAGILVETGGPYYVGDSITVAGGGFAGGETPIKISFAGQTIYSGIKAKQDGTWEYSFDLPPTAYGPHDIEASGDTTTPVTASLSIQAQILEISPTSGAPGDLVSLTGNGFGSNQQPVVTIGGIAASGNMQPSSSSGNLVISFRVPKDAVVGTRTLVVEDGSGASAPGDFTVIKKTLSTTPLPVSPRNGSTLRSEVVTFRWQGVPSADAITYTYTLEIGTLETGQAANSTPFLSKSGLTASNYTIGENEAGLPPNTYYWRIKVVDNYGNQGPWSSPVEFSVSPIPTWVWVVIGVVVFIVLMVVAYRETKFRVTE